uniref:RRM domain-containing protein n=1 Tax=Tetradesmus obliquus TaxID=3088 RepID=A0A383V5I3_TETOB|eukprot:jgi/Sobl393_1/1780/SZX60867.1
MSNKLDMSLDDLIKKSGRTKPAGKQAGGKPGAQKKQQAGKPGTQQKGAGGKGAAKPAVGQQKKGTGVQLKPKGGVAKPGAGKQQQRPKSQPDVRVVPRAGARPQMGGRGPAGGRGMGMRMAPMAGRGGMGGRGMGMGMPRGMQTRFMGNMHPGMMQQAPYHAPMGMGMGPMGMAAGMGGGMPMAAPAAAVAAVPAAAAPAPQSGKWQNDLFDGSVVSSSTSSKLFISNLDFKVTDEDIQELFGTVGTIKDSGVHYDKSGRSMGTAYVVFEKRSDALAAFNRYNNVALDNKKMSIEVVESAVPRGTFKTLSSGINVSRQAQQAAAAAAAGGSFRGRGAPQGDFMQE